jgi:hypothetical protein
VAEAWTRLAGHTPDGATPAGQPPRTRRTADPQGAYRPPGRVRLKAQVPGNDDGIVLDYNAEFGAASDGLQLAQRSAASAGGGCGQRAVERDLHDL